MRWLDHLRARDWETVSALIDIVTVIEQRHDSRSGERYDYLATLTYFYHKPDLQTGDYSRVFTEEEEAQAWAASYKGYTVMVHVDPRDPAQSVMSEEDLDGATAPAPQPHPQDDATG